EQEDRLARRAEDLRYLLVAGRDSRLRIDDEEHEVGLRDRRAGLVGNRPRDRRGGGDVDAARGDQPELGARPFADELLPVGGDAARPVDDRGGRAGQAVDERRLAEVREADNGDGSGQIGHDGIYAGARSRTSRSMWSTTSSTLRFVVSISSASPAGCMRTRS